MVRSAERAVRRARRFLPTHDCRAEASRRRCAAAEQAESVWAAGIDFNAESTAMRENRLRALWREDQTAINGWLAIPDSFSAETMALQGWDSLTIDLQHGLVDYQAMIAMLKAISTTPTVPIVRVPWL
jgi:hypothetical protein